MQKSRNVFYIGSTQEFTNLLESRIQNCSNDTNKHEITYGDWKTLFKFLNQNTIHLLIIDFTGFSEEDLRYGLNQIYHLKNIVANFKIPIVGLLENKKYLVEREYLINSGINYFHIIGDDFNLFFGNIYYIAFEDSSFKMKLAQALKLQLNQNIAQPAYLSGICDSGIRLELDIIIEEEAELSINGFLENKIHKHEVLDQLPFSKFTNSLNCFETSFDFCSDWNQTDSETEQDDSTPVFADNVESWLEILKEDGCFVDSEQIVLHYYCSRLEKSLLQTDSLNSQEAKCRFFKQYKEEVFLVEESPDLIFYEITCEEDLDNIDHLICMLSNNPDEDEVIVLVKNHPSNVRALRKLYQYESILPFNEFISPTDLKKMVESRSKKKERGLYKVLKQDKNEFTVFSSFSTKVTSLTENEITFKTKLEIPYFSIVQIFEPFIISILVVPPYMKLSTNLHGHHYMGLIMGINENERQELRKIVRNFMSSLPDNWKDVTLTNLTVADIEPSVEKGSVESDQMNEEEYIEKEIVLKDIPIQSETNEFTRRKIGDSKSKL